MPSLELVLFIIIICFFYDDSSGASGGCLSCSGKKDTKEAGIGEALRGVLPPPQAPSPMYPTRDALQSDGKLFRCGNVRTETFDILTKMRCGRGIQGRAPVIAGAISQHLPWTAFFGYFLGGARKYRPRQGPEISKMPCVIVHAGHLLYLYSLPSCRAFMFSSMRAAFLGGTSLLTTASTPAKSSSG